ncbi:MAG: tetratricopeptide repeat protein, partial [candidate division WOR-3 bacterium]
EFLIGYGRSVGSAFSIGGVLKLQSQSLAGFSGSGVGLDLGVIVHPLVALLPNSRNGRRLSMGLSVRNAIEPTLRLSEEEVPDPTGVRLGLAYVIPFFQSRAILASFDLEKTKWMNTRLHAGIELQLHSLLALRVGIADGVLTSGTSVQWKGVGVDYTFESGQLDNVHRIGASFSLGPTIEQSRQAALEKQEKEMREKLAVSFEQRQSERIRELFARADNAQSQGRYEEALEILAVIMALEPEHNEAQSKKVQCLLKLGKKYESKGDYTTAALTYSRVLALVDDDPTVKADYDRCRTISDRLAARSKQIRRLFATSMDAFSAQDLVKAREGFSAILQVAPTDMEAADMLKRTNNAIHQRVADLMRQANNLIEWGHLDEAQSVIEEAQNLDPESERVRLTISHLAEAKRTREQYRHQQDERELSAHGASADPDGKTSSHTIDVPSSLEVKPLTEKQKREIKHLYERGMNAMSENNNQDAIRYFELAWSIDHNYQGVVEHLKRMYLMQGMEYFADGKLDKAVQQWENALRVDPTDERAIGYLSRAREQVARTQQILGEKK